MIHDGMPHDPIQGQGQGHRGPKVAKWLISKSISSMSISHDMHVINGLMVNYDTPRLCLNFNRTDF